MAKKNGLLLAFPGHMQGIVQPSSLWLSIYIDIRGWKKTYNTQETTTLTFSENNRTHTGSNFKL